MSNRLLLLLRSCGILFKLKKVKGIKNANIFPEQKSNFVVCRTQENEKKKRGNIMWKRSEEEPSCLLINCKKRLRLCLRVRTPIMPALISGFLSMKQLGVFLLLPGWDASPSQGYPQHFAGTHLYTWVERGTIRVPKNTTQCPRPGPQPGLLDLESSTLTMRPPRLPIDKLLWSRILDKNPFDDEIVIWSHRIRMEFQRPTQHNQHKPIVRGLFPWDL